MLVAVAAVLVLLDKLPPIVRRGVMVVLGQPQPFLGHQQPMLAEAEEE